MRNLTWLAALAPALLIVACSQAPAPAPAAAPDTSAADMAAIRANAEQYVAAWNAGDGATMGPLLAEDAVLMQPDGPATVGREAILQGSAGAYDPATMVQTFTIDEVIVAGDYGYASGTWNLDPKPGAEGPSTRGKWSMLYRRGAAGAWQGYRWMYNADRTEAPAGG
jgi:uncharacterized protein (TIGR02246 family)